MYILYIDSPKYLIPEGVHFKVYADDVKIYGKSGNNMERLLLQRTLDTFKTCADSLDLKLSVQKCGVMHFGHGNVKHPYAISGQTLTKHHVIKDLGVLLEISFGIPNT